MAKTKVLICPYCGDTQTAGERCRSCGGFFEPLSRQATHNAMGPWFIRDDTRPFQPGCSYETLIKLIERGQITKYSILRSPTTKQFWTVAKRVPGISHLLGYCHSCDASVDPGDHGCHACGVPFGAYLDRNYLGLPDVHPLPWEAPDGAAGEEQAASSARKFDFRRAAEPLGISSFASDEELRGHGVAATASYAPSSPGSPATGHTSPAAARWPHSAPIHELSPDAEGPTGESDSNAVSPARVLETSPAGAAARAMQRRFDAQRRTIRMLAVALLVLAALTIVCIVAIVARNRSTSQTGAESSNAPATSPERKSIIRAASNATPSSSAAPTSAPQLSDQQPVIETKAPAHEAELARANELIASAAKTDRELADRIRDYQEALRILKDIEASAGPDQKPADLAAQIKRVQDELERLQLKQFFP